MPTMIQLRHVPDDLHRTLKSRAALAGQSLSDYLLSHIREIAARPTVDELRQRLAARAAIEPSIDPVTILREEREAR